MSEIRKMREKRVKLWETAKAFVESRQDANGLLSAEDSATYDKMEADVVEMGKTIERMERQEERVDKTQDSALEYATRNNQQAAPKPQPQAPQSVGRVCPDCDTVAAQGVRFCAHCGRDLK